MAIALNNNFPFMYISTLNNFPLHSLDIEIHFCRSLYLFIYLPFSVPSKTHFITIFEKPEKHKYITSELENSSKGGIYAKKEENNCTPSYAHAGTHMVLIKHFFFITLGER